MKRYFRTSLPVLVALSLALGLAPFTWAQGITQEQADGILQELRAIRHLLETQQRAQAQASVQARPMKVSLPMTQVSYSLGREDAPVTLVEFTDYQCPYCRRFHSTTFAELKKKFIDSGQVRFVSRDLPLSFHPQALSAALAARCAGEEGKLWEMRDLLLGNASKLDLEALRGYAEQLHLALDTFQTCLESHKYEEAIQADVTAASAAGITGTPTFVIGRTNASTLDGVKIVGAQPIAVFEAHIRKFASADNH